MILRIARHDRNFTIIDNSVLRDPTISFRATGLLAYMLSMPDGWEPSGRDLADVKTCKRGEGRDAVFAALSEVEAAGYLVRTTEHSPDGYWVHVSTIYESLADAEKVREVLSASGARTPDPDFQDRAPSPGNPDPVNPDPVNPDPDFQDVRAKYQEQIPTPPQPKGKKNTSPLVSAPPSSPAEPPPTTPSAEKVQASRRRALPADFALTAVMREWAVKNTPGVDADAEFEQFLDHHRSRGNTMLDWQAAWRKWMRNGKKWASRSSYGKVDRTNRNPDNVASREGETKVTYPAAHYRRLEALAQRELAQA